MAYILGVLHGDGGVYKIWHKAVNRFYYRVCLGTISRLFADAFVNALNNIGLKAKVYGPYSQPPRLFPNGHLSLCKPIYFARAYSEELYGWFQRFNPKTNPDWLKNLESYLDIPEKQHLWLRGFYESEGSIWLGKQKSPYRVYTYPRICFTNSNIKLLELTQKILLRSNFEPSLKISKERTVYYLYLQRNVTNFINWIHPCIKIQPNKGAI